MTIKRGSTVVFKSFVKVVILIFSSKTHLANAEYSVLYVDGDYVHIQIEGSTVEVPTIILKQVS